MKEEKSQELVEDEVDSKNTNENSKESGIEDFDGADRKEAASEGYRNSQMVEDELDDMISISQDFNIEDDVFDLDEALKKQVNDELEKQNTEKKKEMKSKKSKKRLKRVLKVTGIVFGVLILLSAWLVGTKSGRHVIYKLAGNFIYDSVDRAIPAKAQSTNVVNNDPVKSAVPTAAAIQDEISPLYFDAPRHEKYVSNFLIFGVEEFGGAKNTDSMMIASINTKDNSIKIASIMRDTLVKAPDGDLEKINSIYAVDGVDQLVQTIEQNFLIDIEGYASIDFEDFEEIVDYLGGITLDLGEKEAHYLNTTNYISNPANRNVHAGRNDLNGNQVLGYCRIRKVETLGGVNNDYGRTLRQRRVLNAIFDKYKSNNLFDLLSITKNCLGYISTNVSEGQIEKMLEDIVENKIRRMDSYRLPVDGMFEAPEEYEGVTYPIVVDWEENILDYYKFLYLDSDADALTEYNAHKID